MTPVMASIGALLLWAALASPAQAQMRGWPPGIAVTQEPAVAATAKEAAGDLQRSLGQIAKTGARPDYSAPPLADEFGRAFNVEDLAALPPPQAGDLAWLMDWGGAANGAFKSIQFFGIAPPVTPLTDGAALQRNLTDYEDQAVMAADFLLRFFARESQAAAAFSEQLTPALRTAVRMEGFRKMRVAGAEIVLNDLGWIIAGMKPANAHLISVALRDTGAVWATAILPADRPAVAAAAARAAAAVKDEDSRNNLASFGTIMTNAK